jgi:hypothetical protein
LQDRKEANLGVMMWHLCTVSHQPLRDFLPSEPFAFNKHRVVVLPACEKQQDIQNLYHMPGVIFFDPAIRSQANSTGACPPPLLCVDRQYGLVARKIAAPLVLKLVQDSDKCIVPSIA